MLNTVLDPSGIAKLPVIPKYDSPVLILSLCIRLARFAYTSDTERKVGVLGLDEVETVWLPSEVVTPLIRLFISTREYCEGVDVETSDVGERVPAETKRKMMVRREKEMSRLYRKLVLRWVIW